MLAVRMAAARRAIAERNRKEFASNTAYRMPDTSRYREERPFDNGLSTDFGGY